MADRIPKNRIVHDLKIIQSLLGEVPKKIAPDKDPAILFYKTQDFVNKTLKKYMEA